MLVQQLSGQIWLTTGANSGGVLRRSANAAVVSHLVTR